MIWLIPIIFVLVFIILAALGLLLVPEWARLAERNLQQRQTLLTESEELTQRANHLDTRVQAFRKARSTRSRTSYEACVQHIQSARSQLKNVTAIQSWPFGRVPEGQSPEMFFGKNPAHLLHVPRNKYRLRQVWQALQAAKASLDSADIAWATLNSSAEQLRADCHTLLSRTLPNLRERLDTLAAQELQLDDFNTRFKQCLQETHQIEESLRMQPDTPIRLLDELAVDLDRWKLTIEQLATDLEGVDRGYRQTDAALLKARQRLALIPSLATGDGPQLMDSRAFSQRAEALLREAEAFRRQLLWDTAVARAAVSEKSSNLVLALNSVTQVLNQLNDIKHRSRFSQAIENLATRYNTTLHNAHVLLLSQERDTPNDLGQRLTNTTQLLIDLAEDGRALLANHQSDLHRTEQQAAAALRQLQVAWQAAQTVVPLHQDPLNSKVAHVIVQQTATAGHPAELEGFISAANSLTDRLHVVEKTVRGQLEQVDALLGALPDQWAFAQRQAARWACLAEDQANVQTCIAQAHTRREQLSARGRLDETLRDIEEINALVKTVQLVNQRIETWADRLDKLEEDIAACQQAAQAGAGQDTPTQYMINYHRDRARASGKPEQALVELQEAYRFARQMLSA